MGSTDSTTWYQIAAAEVAVRHGTDLAQGLSDAEAGRRLEAHGPNELVESGGRTVWQILWEQVASTMIVILIIAAALAAALGKIVDASAIVAIVVLFVVLGFVQEYRAQKAIAALKQMAAPLVRVLRSGQLREISARLLVPGDVVKIETGGVVPADCRVVESVNLRVQEAALTGESEPVEKITEPLPGDDLTVGDRRNMAFMGTFASYGRGTAVVVGTGMRTELGKIATLIQTVQHDPTPLQRRLDGLGKTLALVALAIAGFVILTGWWRGEDLTLMLLTGVSLAVAIVPEGLPAVLTFTLALGAQRMLKRKALIRKLPAVETLGSVTVICSDKTGTLTQNRMTVTVLETAGVRLDLGGTRPGAEAGGAHTLPEDQPALRLLLAAGSLCNDAVLERTGSPADPVTAVGDPTEGALVVAAARFGLAKPDLDGAFRRVAELPFDSDRKRMTTIHAAGSTPAGSLPAFAAAPFVAVTKGAADGMLAVCSRVWAEGRAQPLDAGWRKRIAAATDRMTRNGMRVLGIGFRPLAVPPAEPATAAVESDLVFLGLIGMIDPPRAEAKAAVATCKTAGIRPVMITGDHPLTARAIAAELGITTPEARVLTGQELERMSLEDLKAAVEEISVYARVSPEHKLKIIQALQEKGHVVAMTGDGVNDAPALKKADIGVAMGSGTDVAKEAADMVLLDDNFATIVAAVEEGRVVYDNLRRFVMFSVSGNIGKVLIVSIPPFFGMPLLLLPIQILWSNLLTDGLLGLGMGVEKAEPDTMRRPPVPPQEGVFSRGLGLHVAWIGPLIGALVIGVGWWYWSQSLDDGVLNDREELYLITMVFTALAMLQLGRALASRSFQQPIWTMNPAGNRVLFGMVLLALVLQMTVVYLPAAQPFFHTVSPTATGLLLGVGVAVVVVLAMEFDKASQRRRGH